jgi:diguanylate cyclase (GGDEF)-like protein
MWRQLGVPGGGERRLDLDRLKRPTYLAASVLGLPVIVLVMLARWSSEPALQVAYPLLLAIVAAVAIGLATDRLSVATAERIVLVTVPALWLARLGVLLYGGGPLDEARAVITESIGPGLIVIVVIAYLAMDARTGLQVSLTLSALFGAVVVPRAVAAIGTAGDGAAVLAMVRMVVWVGVISLLTYVLAHLKEQLAEQRERAAGLDLLASTDPVTGIANRRQAALVLEERLAEADRYGRPLSVVLLDLDGFKAVNDTAGHAAGDRALRSVVQALATDLRQGDVLARWGGDELLVIAPETGLEEIERSADRWRRRVLELGIATGDEVLTVSAGVTTRREGDTVDTIVQRADTAMYRAKSDGRDRTVVLG